MKFRVIGHRKDNAHRVTLEFEAQSKAQAEREAIKQGLEVVRVEIVQEGAGGGGGTYAVGQAASEGQVKRSSSGGGGAGKLIILLIVLAGIAGAVYFFWDTIKGMIPGLS